VQSFLQPLHKPVHAEEHREQGSLQKVPHPEQRPVHRLDTDWQIKAAMFKDFCFISGNKQWFE